MREKLWEFDTDQVHIHYLANPGFSSTFVWNCNWLSIIWKSSGGWGILPVSSFDQTGTSGREKHTINKHIQYMHKIKIAAEIKRAPIHTIDYAFSKQ